MLRSTRSLALAMLLAPVTLFLGCGSSHSPSSGPGANSVPGYGVGTGASGQTAPAKFIYANPAGLGDRTRWQSNPAGCCLLKPLARPTTFIP